MTKPETEWVLVPREPTEAMKEAAYRKRPFYTGDNHAVIYKSMLAAAPSAPLTETALVKEWERWKDGALPHCQNVGDRMAAEVERLTGDYARVLENMRNEHERAEAAEAALETARVALETAIEAHEGIARDCLLRASATGLDGERHIYQQFAALNLERAAAIRAALPLPALPKTKGDAT